MRTPVSGDRALGYIVNSPGPMGNVRVSTLEPTREESLTPALCAVQTPKLVTDRR